MRFPQNITFTMLFDFCSIFCVWLGIFDWFMKLYLSWVSASLAVNLFLFLLPFNIIFLCVSIYHFDWLKNWKGTSIVAHSHIHKRGGLLHSIEWVCSLFHWWILHKRWHSKNLILKFEAKMFLITVCPYGIFPTVV